MSEGVKISLRDVLNGTTGGETNLKISNEIQRQDIVGMTDTMFFERTTFAFTNNKYTNAFFVNEIQDREFSDLATSINIIYDEIESCIRLEDPMEDGTYFSTSICTDVNYDSDLNNFFLISDEDVPAGCDILYYIITDDNRMFPIKPNGTTPLTFVIKPKKFRLKIVIHANGLDYPAVRSYSILYHDQFIEDGYGLINPNFTKKPIDYDGFEDIITLVRNNKNEDKLAQVISSLDTVKLTYDSEGKLSKVETYDNINGDKTEENDLVYGDYLDSKGVIENVLLQVKTKTSFDNETNP